MPIVRFKGFGEVEVVEVAAVQAGGVVMVLASSDTAPLRAKTRVTGSEP